MTNSKTNFETKKFICDECNEYVEFFLKDINIKEEIRGGIVEVIGKEAHCSKCGNEMYIGEIEDNNIDLIDRKYREIVGLLQIEEINKILELYNIGKKPLCVLLGWGETTIIRYLDGATPTKQYSSILKEILNNPMAMKDLLIKNKDNEAFSKVAYTKSMKAVEKALLTSQSSTNSSRLDKAINFFLSKSDEITHLMLQKLLYNTQGWSSAINEIFMFNEDCQAWAHGPVYKEVYNKYSSYGASPLPQVTIDNLELSDEEKHILEGVWKAYGGFNGKQLEKMSHSEMPWLKTRDGLDENESSIRVIEKECIKNYFDKVRDKYDIVNPEYISEYSFVLAQKVGI